MRICDKCGLPIRSYMYWSKYIDGEKVYICNDCVSALPDIRTTNGLDLVIDKKNKDNAVKKSKLLDIADEREKLGFIETAETLRRAVRNERD